MAFNTNTPRVSYIAAAGQTVFPFTFKIFTNTNLTVYKNSIALVLSTNYTVTINGDSGGEVTLLVGASLSDEIVIVRSLPITREFDYQDNGDFFADTVDNDQDYQTYLVQDVDAKFDRTFTLPDSISGTVSSELPFPINDAYIRWNSDSTAIINDTEIPSAVLLAKDWANKAEDSVVADGEYSAKHYALKATTQAGEASISASQALGYRNEAEAFSISKAFVVDTIEALSTIPSSYTTAIVKDLDRGGTFIWSATGTANGGTVFAGATGYWVRQYSGAVNVKWFGAKDTRIAGNENYDSYTNIYNALQFIKSINGGSLYFPSGTYKCSQTLYFGGDTGIDESIKIFGDGHQMVFGNSDGGSRLVYTGTTGFLFGLNVDSAGVGQSLFGRLILEDIILLGTGEPTTNELDTTCIKGYRSRPTLNRVTIGNFSNGITFGGTGYYGADYSDLNTYTNVRFGNIYGNHCMKLYGADNSTIQGVYIEGCDCLIGIEIASTFGVGIKDCLINNVGTGVLLKYGGGMFLSNIHSEEVSGSFINTVDIKGLEVNGYYYQTSNTTTSRLLFVGSDTSGGLEDGSTYIEMTNGVIIKETGATSDIYIQTKSDYVYVRNTRSVTNAGALRELSISYQDISTQQFSQNLCKVANESFVYEFTADGTYGTVGKLLSIASLFQYATKATLEVINYYSGGGSYASAYYEGIILREAYNVSTSTFRLVETKTISGSATVTNLNGYKPTINATTGELSFYQTNSYGTSISYKVVLKMSFI